MNSSTRIIFKNVGALMTSQLLTWSLTLLVTIFLPRQLGPTQVGQLYMAISLWSIVTILCRFGTEVYIIKAIARTPERAPQLLGTTLLARGGTFVLGAIAVALYVKLVGYPPAVIGVIVITGVAGLLELIAGAFTGTLQGLEKMEYISLGMVADKLVYAILVLVGLFVFNVGVLWIAVLYTVGSAALLAVVAWGYLRQLPIKTPSMREVIPLLKASSPYLLASLVVVVYNEIDKQIIAVMIDEQAVGYYTTAATLFNTVMFIPVVLTTALFPMMARSFKDAPDALRRVNRKSFNIMFIVGVPVSFGIMSIARPLIQLIYGPEFAPAGPILALMGIVVVFVYLNILIAQILTSTEQIGRWTMVLVISTIVTIILDILLIPWSHRVFNNGALAGAISFMITEAGQTIVGIFLIPRNTLNWLNVITATRSLLAGLMMVGVCWLVRDMFILVPVLVGAVTYIGLILAFRVLPGEDLQMIKRLIGQIVGRLRSIRSQVSIT